MCCDDMMLLTKLHIHYATLRIPPKKEMDFMESIGLGENTFKRSVVQQVESKIIVKSDYGECWVPKLTPSSNRYCFMGYTEKGKNKKMTLHIASYIVYKGKIDKGNHIHHKCNNKVCFNPEHLEQLTNSEHAIITNTGNTRNRNKMTVNSNNKYGLGVHKQRNKYVLVWQRKEAKNYIITVLNYESKEKCEKHKKFVIRMLDKYYSNFNELSIEERIRIIERFKISKA